MDEFRSSAGLLPRADAHPGAVLRIFSARTVSWRGIVATHSWIVLKEAGARAYYRFDYTAWGQPIWVDRFVPDGRWFGNPPTTVFAADGPEAETMLPRIRQAVAEYRYSRPGDYVVWPGPNSNTFVAAVMAAVPEIRASLPTTAIGKDFPYDGRWIGPTPSRTGIRLNLGGYAGLTLGWVEGLELNLLGAWPFAGSFQVIFCRNVAIYFEEATQQALWARFAERLTPEGRLYIGHSERANHPRLATDGLTTYRLREGVR